MGIKRSQKRQKDQKGQSKSNPHETFSFGNVFCDLKIELPNFMLDNQTKYRKA